ncbi:MAG: zinc ribbon domain-containing protein [Proteobacteria bacterium]|nr:zinc ribbon domain-containing protein [Pseudomonadota bacterium]
MAEVKVANLGLLLRCYEGLRNWRALAMLVAGFVIAALLIALNGVMFTHLVSHSFTLAKLLGGLLAIIAVLVLLAGINGAGLLLVDEADNAPPRSFTAAFFGGLGVTLQAIACLIILGVGFLLVVLVLWALSFLSRIPGIGPLFAFLLAGPTMLVLAFCYALLVFGVALMFVALWRGNGMVGSIGRAIDIVVKRPLDVVLHFIVLWLLIVPIEIFVVAVLFGGSALTGAMYGSASALGGGMLGDGMMGGGGMMSMLAGAGAGMGAAAISIGIVLAAIWAGFVLIAMLGNILIFDSLAAETSATSAGFLAAKVRQLKDKVEEHRPQATAAPRAAAPAAASCGQCGAALTPGDRFCGECGAPTA